METPAPIMRDQREIDSGHLKVLSICYYVSVGRDTVKIQFDEAAVGMGGEDK